MGFKKTENFDCLICGKEVVKNGIVKTRAGRIQTEGYWCWDCIEDNYKEQQLAPIHSPSLKAGVSLGVS